MYPDVLVYCCMSPCDMFSDFQVLLLLCFNVMCGAAMWLSASLLLYLLYVTLTPVVTYWPLKATTVMTFPFGNMDKVKYQEALCILCVVH